MLPLILFIVLAVVVVTLVEINERRKANHPDSSAATQNAARPDGCCGEHLVCERETLLQTNAEVIYYDDEELDELSGLNPDTYTAQQRQAFRDVFNTLQESDVPGWCRSLQLRHIELPSDIREEALLIVRERRRAK